MELKDLRNEINAIDAQLVPLFLKRMGVSLEVAKVKQEKHMPVLDRTRERELLKAVGEMTDDPDLRLYTRLLYADIMGLSRAYQRKYLHPPVSPLTAQLQNAIEASSKSDLPATAVVAWRERIPPSPVNGSLNSPTLCFLKPGRACLPPCSRGFANTASCRLKTAPQARSTTSTI